MFLDGYSITRTSILRKVLESVYDILRSNDGRMKALWKKDVRVKKISDMYT